MRYCTQQFYHSLPIAINVPALARPWFASIKNCQNPKKKQQTIHKNIFSTYNHDTMICNELISFGGWFAMLIWHQLHRFLVGLQKPRHLQLITNLGGLPTTWAAVVSTLSPGILGEESWTSFMQRGGQTWRAELRREARRSWTNFLDFLLHSFTTCCL